MSEYDLRMNTKKEESVRTFSKLLFSGVITLFAALSVLAVNRSSFSYQGRVTNPGGDPVPDGIYSVRIKMYNAPVAGFMFYDSGPESVNIADGLFSTILDSIPYLFDSTWLGVTIGTDPEITPRTLLTGTPYSLYTRSISQAEAGVVYGQFQVADGPTSFASFKTEPIDRTIQTLSATGALTSSIGGVGNGNLKLYNNSASEMITMSGGTIKSSAELKRSTGVKGISLDAQTTGQGGVITVTQSDNTTGAVLSSGDPSAAQTGGFLSLHNNAGSALISLDASTTGNSSVIFPADAVSAAEQFNEPGIANAYKFNSVDVTSTTDVRIDSLSITTPSSGFLVITISGYCDIDHTTGTDTEGRVWTSTTGSLTFDNFSFFAIDDAQATETYYQPFSYTFVDDVSAGTFKYVTVADRTSASGSFVVQRLHMTAQYFPTAYGSTISTSPPTPFVAEEAPAHGGSVQLSKSNKTTLESHQASIRAEISRIQEELNAALMKLDQLNEQR